MASLGVSHACLAFVFLLFTFSEARELPVGGKENAWKIPSNPNDFNEWAQKTRFLIGDTLVMVYDPTADSVLQVTEEDYRSCNKAKPIKVYSEGHTKIELDRSGPFYFISGAEGHCEKGEKLVVRVLSPNHGSKPASPQPSPAPKFQAPAPAPVGGAHGLGGAMSGLGVVLGTLVGLATWH